MAVWANMKYKKCTLQNEPSPLNSTISVTEKYHPNETAKERNNHSFFLRNSLDLYPQIFWWWIWVYRKSLHATSVSKIFHNKLTYYFLRVSHKIKALKIHKRKCSPEIQNNSFSNNTLHWQINLFNNSTTNIIEKNLNKLGIKTVTCGNWIKNYKKTKNKQTNKQDKPKTKQLHEKIRIRIK